MHPTLESQWWQRLWEKTLRSVYTSSWSLEKITLFSTIGNTEKTNFYLSFYFVNFLLLHSCSCSTSINVIRKRNISIFIVQVIQFEWYHWQFDIISLSPDCSFEKWSVPNSTNFDAVHLHIISSFQLCGWSVYVWCREGTERILSQGANITHITLRAHASSLLHGTVHDHENLKSTWREKGRRLCMTVCSGPYQGKRGP